ncbi:MAG: CCA tRNA nucleotidyltransferase [Acholeplasmataceae bacterium]
MSTIKTAKGVLYELKKQGYEAYIVGGAVRDYRLRMPINDVDITTNAKPHQVSKIFRTIPTGIKYGTVTVKFKDEQFEVTTYRIDGEYNDNRHPDQITYSETVIEDVKRRDFTINGLLMNEKQEVIDYVDGEQDLKDKIIRTIGDPYKRFEEDALRMLRAFYFQSKLGFQIEKQTRDAIEALRDKLKNVSMERIVNELIKTIQGPHLKKALKSMVTTKVHEVLPGLKKGIEHILEMEEMPYVDPFFVICFALNGGIVPQAWTFSNKHRHRYQQAAELANKTTTFDAIHLYTYGLDLCTLANKVNFMLGRSKNLKDFIEKTYHSLPIQSELDLKLRATEMIEITGKKAGAWLKDIQQEMVLKVLNKELKNEKDVLVTYLIEHIK